MSVLTYNEYFLRCNTIQQVLTILVATTEWWSYRLLEYVDLIPTTAKCVCDDHVFFPVFFFILCMDIHYLSTNNKTIAYFEAKLR